MMCTRRLRLMVAALVLWMAVGAEAIQIQSPSGQLRAKITAERGKLQYEVWCGEKCVLEAAALGITVDAVDLGDDVELGEPKLGSFNETFPTRGVHSVGHNH